MSVAGLRLGDRESAKAMLSEYQPSRMTDDSPAYSFYNKNADTVMKVTASPEDRFFITGIEVYAVDESYRTRHFQMENVAHFATESGVFIGWTQSGKGIAATLIIGVPYPLGVNSIGTKEIVKRYGEPTTRTRNGKIRDSSTALRRQSCQTLTRQNIVMPHASNFAKATSNASP